MGFFYFFNCIALAGGPHIITYKAAGLKEHDAFWRCVHVVLMYGFFQLSRMFLATLVHFNFDTLSPAGLFNYELLGVLINLMAVRFSYSQFGRSEIAIFIGCIGWSYGDLIFAKIVPLWTGTRLLEFDLAYIGLSLEANYELIFNFVIFLTPWLFMRKQKNAQAACISTLIYIIACFHLSIYRFMEQLIGNLFYAAVAKSIFALLMGLVGLFLKVTWVTEAPHESKNQSEDRITFLKLKNQICNFCLQTLGNTVTRTSAQRVASGRRNG